MDINKDRFKEWYDYAKQLEYEHTLMQAEIGSLETGLVILQQENKELRKTEPEWVRYFDESMRQILEQKQKLKAIRGKIVFATTYGSVTELADEILELL